MMIQTSPPVEVNQKGGRFYLEYCKEERHECVDLGVEFFSLGQLFWGKDGEILTMYQLKKGEFPRVIRKMREYILLRDERVLYRRVEKDEWYVFNPLSEEKVRLGILFCNCDDGSKIFVAKEWPNIKFTRYENGNLSSIYCASWKWRDNNSLLLQESGERETVLKIR